MDQRILMQRNEFSFEEIYRAYIDCRKHKRYKDESLQYEVYAERNLYELVKRINNREYKVGLSKLFVVTHPKPREVWCATFEDRVVHHLIYNTINPFFEKRFIEDSFSCIKGRGTLNASIRLEQMYRRVSNNYDYPVWYLQIDFANFFCSINKDILWSIFEPFFMKDTLTKYLLKEVIFHNPVDNYIKTGLNFNKILPHKSLFNCNRNNGLAIGNLTSQFFSNVYLNEVDQYVKHKLKQKNYIRYVDDAVILSKDREELIDCLLEILQYSYDRLDLNLNHSKTKLQPMKNGIDFVGYIIKPFHKTKRKTLLNNCKNKITDGCNAQVLNSYLGFLIHCKSYKQRKQIVTMFEKSNDDYSHSKDYSKVFKA